MSLSLAALSLFASCSDLPFGDDERERSPAPASTPAPSPPSDIPDRIVVGERTFELQRVTELDGPPLGLSFNGDEDGYVAQGSGEILHFSLDDDGSFETETVAEGLSQPRDVAVLDDRLFVTDVRFPCKRKSAEFELVRCFPTNFRDLSPEDAEVKIVEESDGRIVSYAISDDGELTQEDVVVDELPIGFSDHAVNGITPGPDGRLYVAIGNVGGLFKSAEAIDRIDRDNKDLLGTIVSFDPDAEEPELDVFARGVRNVYHLAFDDAGELYGVDNDGLARSGWRGEEVDRFDEGADYGYPAEGSLGPFEIRTGFPMWFMRANGSAGLTWAPRVGLERGLVVGSCGRVTYLHFSPRSPIYGEDEKELLTPDGCTTIVEGAPDERLVIGTISPHRLIVYKGEGEVEPAESEPPESGR